jgi:hypothetical protein
MILNKLTIVLLTASIITLTGCSNIHKRDSVGIFDSTPLPTFMPLNVTEIDNVTLGVDDFKITDERVYKFAFILRDTLAKKVKQGRVGEELFSGLQVILSTFAAAFSASTGVHVDVVTALAGLSSLTPDIADIISAGDKAKAYSQGLDLVEAAISKYIETAMPNVPAGGDLISKSKLTAEGAQLFVTTVSSLKVTRDALLLTIPDIEVLAKATGKYELFAMNTNSIDINVSAAELDGSTAAAGANTAAITAANINAAAMNIGVLSKVAQKRYIKESVVVKGKKLRFCSSETPAVATVLSCAGNQTITIEPHAEGTTVITVINDTGGKASITVNVNAT